MATATISFEADSETAKAYASASAEERRKLDLLLEIRLRELTSQPKRSLREVMDEIGNRAEALGLTPEVLASLMSDE